MTDELVEQESVGESWLGTYHFAEPAGTEGWR